MAAADRVFTAAGTAKPYVERAIRDEEFRSNLRAAFAAARAIYDELSSQRGLTSVASTAATDEEIHTNLRRAIGELRQAADRLQMRDQEHRSHTMRNVALVLTGVVIGIFFNPFTGPNSRRWVKSKVTTSGNSGPPDTSANSGYGAAE
jgi:hypothetical protein